MITLNKIAYQFIRKQSGGDKIKDSQIRKNYVILLARQALNSLIKPVFFENLQMGDRGTIPMFICSYDVDVKDEDITERKYIDIPEFYIHLPYNKGLRSISPVDDPLNTFKPRHNPMVTQGLPAGKLAGHYGYYVEGMKSFFDEKVDQDGVEKVTIKLLVAAPDTLGKDDPLPIYAEQQVQLFALLQQLWADAPPQDKLVDENADYLGVRTKQ